MKNLIITLTAFLTLTTGSLLAQENESQVLTADQVSQINFSGKWVGKRKQYSADKKSFAEVFQYEFDLKQEGNIITGTTTIITSNGEYADMKLEGMVIGNKLHFAETEVKAAERPEGKLWCFKTGELNIIKQGDKLLLQGATPSYMETYNIPCSGGETELVKVDNSSNLSVIYNTPSTNTRTVSDFSMNLFPNPFVTSATLSYTLTDDAKVSVEIFDISGRLISNLFTGNQKAGKYNMTYDGTNSGSMSGVLIVKMTVNGEVYSHQLVQMK